MIERIGRPMDASVQSKLSSHHVRDILLKFFYLQVCQGWLQTVDSASSMTDGAQSSHSCEAPFQVRCTTGIGHLIWTLTEVQLLRKLKWCYRP